MKLSIFLCTILIVFSLSVSCEENKRTKRTLNVLLRLFGYQIVPVDTELVSPNVRNPRLNRLQTVAPPRAAQNTQRVAPQMSTNQQAVPATRATTNAPMPMPTTMEAPASMNSNAAMPETPMRSENSAMGSMEATAMGQPPSSMSQSPEMDQQPRPRSRLEDMMIRSQEGDNEFIIRMVNDLNKNAQRQAEDVENINGMEVNTSVDDQSEINPAEESDDDSFLSQIPDFFSSSNFAKDSEKNAKNVKSEKIIKYVPQGQQNYISQYFQPPSSQSNQFYDFGDNYEIVQSKDMTDKYLVGNANSVSDSNFAPKFKPLSMPYSQGFRAQSGMQYNSNGHNFGYNSFH
jgi:hypothetical protein